MPTLPTISPQIIQKYQEEMAKAASPATAKRKAASLNKFFGWAEEKGHIETNPMPQAFTNSINDRIDSVSKPKGRISAKTWVLTGTTLGLIILIFLLSWKVGSPIEFVKNFAAGVDNNPTAKITLDNQNILPNSTPSGSISANNASNGSWNLYANLKLSNEDGTPKVGSQTLSFKVYSAETGGTVLYTSQPQTITTDDEGSALIFLDGVPSNLFFENQKLFVEPEIASATATVRIPVSTANVAANLGGYFPADPKVGANALTVPVIDENGSLNLASESPAINAKAGNLLVQGQALTLKTVDGTNGNIEVNPDGSGIAHFLFEGSSGNFLNAQAPNLNSGSLYYGIVANNATGYDLIRLQSGSKPITRFSVDALGNTMATGNINAGGSIQTGGTTRISSTGALQNITGYSQNSGNFVINQDPGDFASITKTGRALNNAVTLTLDERGQTTNTSYSTLVLNRYNAFGTGMALLVSNGNAQFDGQVKLGNFVTNPTNVGTGSMVYNSTENIIYFWNGSAWVSVGTAATVPFSGLLSGTNTTATMIVGTGASLSTSGTGTISATDLTCSNCVANSELVNSSITVNSGGILTGGGSVALGGTINLTATEADTLDSVTTRGATTTNTLTVGNLIDSGLTASKVVFTDGSKQLTSTGSIGVDQGGTGFSSYAIGDMLYADTTTSLARLADVAIGNVLLSGGIGVAPSWGQIVLGTHTTGNYVSSLTGTANQIDVSGSTGDITLSTPSDFRAPGTVNAVNGIYTGLAAGTQRIDASGNLTNIGTTQFNTVTYTWPNADGGSGQVLSTNGAGGLSWTSSLTASSVFWDQSTVNGVLFPKNNTVDVLIGSDATSSAKFAFTGVSSGTPTASIAGTTPNVATYLTGNGNLAVTNMEHLTIGGATTGGIDFASPITSGTWNGTAIGATYGGTGQTVYAIGDMLYADSTTTLAKLADVAVGNVLLSGGIGAAPSWGQIILGTHTTGNYVSSLTGTANQITVSTSTGDITLSIPSDFRAPGTVNAVNGIYTGATAGTQRIDASGNLVNIGTTQINGVTYTWPGTATANYVLQSTGTGATSTLAWVDPAAAVASSIYWTSAEGALFPKNSSMDLLIGGSATSSAKFTFTGVSSGTPTASISGTYLTSTGNLANTNMEDITLGGATTGNVIASSPFSAGSITDTGLTASKVVFTDANKTLTSTGTVAVDQGGTGQTVYVIGDMLYADTTTSLARLADVAVGNVLLSGGIGAAPSYGKVVLGTHTTGNYVSSLAGTANQITASAATGDITLSIPSDFRAPGTVNAVNGIYTGATAGTQRIDASGNLVNIGTTQLNGVTYTWPGSATANYVLQSTGTGASSTLAWVDPLAAIASSIYWTSAEGALFPKNNSLDVLIGSDATSSAKFAFTGVSSGTPTASISGTYLTSTGNLANTNMEDITLGGVTTGNVISSSPFSAGSITDTGLTASKGVFTDANKTLTSTGNLGVDQGGTGITSYTVGDLLYADTTSSLAKLSDIATGNVLLSGGIGTAPSYGKVVLGTHTSGNYVSSLSGTANQITASASTGDITLSIPSDFRAPGTVNAVNGIYTGATAGTQRIDASGNLTNIGTTQFNTVTYTWPNADGGTGQVLSTNGSGQLSWTPALTDSSVFWTQNSANGILFPKNNSVDVLIGSDATTSAKFAFTGVSSGTPTASIAGSTANVSTYLTGNGTLATTNMNHLTIGNSDTGGVDFGSPITSGTWNGSAIGAIYGGTGQTSYAVGDLLYADTTTTLAKLADVAVGNALISGGIGVSPSWGKIVLGTHTSGNYVSSLAGTANQITASASTGDITLSIPSDFRAPGTVNAVNGLYTGATAGTQRIDASGNLTNIGTTQINGVTYTWPASATANYVLQAQNTGATSTLAWVDPAAAVASSIYWTSAEGALFPKSNSLDVLIGSTATSSAKFAFTGVNSGTPTASISGTYLTSTGNLANTNMEDITLGGATTGNVISSSPFQAASITDTGLTASKVVFTDANKTLTSTGTVAVDQGGTGQTVYVIGDMLYADSTSTLAKLNDVAVGNVLLSGGIGAAPSYGKVVLGTHTTGNYVSSLAGTANQITASASTGDITLSIPSDFRAPGTVNAVNGIYTGATAGTQRIDASGNLTNIGTTQINGVTYTWPASATANYVLQSTGTGASSTLAWVDPAAAVASSIYWTSGQGALYPKNNSLDMLLGSSATSSAKFAFTGVASGIPTASIAGSTTNVSTYLTGNGTLATTNMNHLTIGGATTGGVDFGSPITSGTWNGTAIGATYGGTGHSLYAIGDMLYADSTTTLARLADVATGNVLLSGGIGAAPSWGQITLGTHTTGNYVSSIAGTANQITASASTGDVTLSIPSDFRAPGTVNAVNGLYTGATAGTQRIDASGNLTNIGTTQFNTKTYTWPNSIAANNYVLQTQTDGTLAWVDPAAAIASNIYWTSAEGALFPKSSSMDVLIGSSSTSSAKFAFTGVSSGTPTASISGTYLTSTGNLANTNMEDITLGGATTGNVISSSPFSAGSITDTGLTASKGVFTDANKTLTSTGVLGTDQGGTGLNSYTTGDLIYASNTNVLSQLANVATGNALISGGVGTAPSWGKIVLGTHTSGNYVSSLAGTANQITASAATGDITLSIPSDFRAPGTVNAVNGIYTGATAGTQRIDASGNLVNIGTTQLNGVTYTWPASATANYVLQSTGTGASSTLAWVDPASAIASNIYWTSAEGALFPKNNSLDLLIGSSATSSAKFAFTGVSSGTPTASISGTYLTSTGNLANTNMEDITLGGATTGNVIASSPFSAGSITDTGLTASKVLFTDANKTLTSTGTVAANQGGTGQSVYAVGDMLYADSTTTLAKLADVAVGNVLLSGGIGVAPSWGQIVLGTHTTGDFVSSLTGTANQITVSASTGDITLSIPSDFRAPGTVNATTGLYTGATAGTQRIDASGNLTNIGTTQLNTVTYTWPNADAGVSGYVLSSNAAGQLSWVDNGAGGAGGTWTIDPAGVIYPNGQTLDVLIGGTATSSAKFAFTGVSSGTPTASISGTYLTSTGNLANTSMRNLTLGGSTTGNVIINSRGSTALTANGPDLTASGDLNISGNVTGGTWVANTIAANHGGTGFSGYTVGDILYADTTTTLAKLADVATGNALISGGVGTAPSWGKITLGTHTTGNYVSSLAGTANQITASAATGDITLSIPSDFRAPGTVNAVNGLYTGATAGTQRIDASGNLTSIGTTQLNGVTYTWPASATANYVLQSTGTGASSTLAWVDPASAIASVIYWTAAEGALFPKNNTMDLLLGSSATSSAKFAFTGVNSGTPTASISGTYLTSTGNLSNTSMRDLTLGSATTGNVTINSRGQTALTANGLSLTTGGDLAIADTYTLQVGGKTGIDYNAFANSAESPIGAAAIAAITADNDLFVGGDFQAGGTIYDASGNVLAGYWTESAGKLFPTTLTNNVGIGTNSPLSKLSVVSTSANSTGKAAFLVDQYETQDIFTASASGVTKLVLENDGTLKLFNATSSISNSAGDITIDAASDFISFAGDDIGNIGTITATTGILTSNLQVNNAVATAYNRLGTNTTNHSGGITDGSDLLISSDLELDGNLYLDSGIIANLAGTATIIFSSAPTSTANTLGAGNWLVDNTANVGQAAFLVNQQKSGDIFTASASGVSKFTVHNDGSITLAGMASTTNTTEGTIYYDTDVDHLYLRTGDSAFHRLALDMTKYATTAANIANLGYVEVAHNQNTNDISLTGWVKNTITNLWEKVTDKSVTMKQSLQNEFDSASASGKVRVETIASMSGGGVKLSQSADVGTGADGAVTIAANTDINATGSISGRTCADAVNYSVSSLTANTAVLSTSPAVGCLVAGDEVLLINLQGTSTYYGNVGNYETLRVSSVLTDTVTFTTNKTKYYGNGTNADDSNIGTATTNQRVMLQRVPNYSNLTVNASQNFYPTAWDGTKGGVMFLRVSGTATINGTIHANARGYRGATTGGGDNGGGNGGEAFCGIGGAGGASGAAGSAGAAGGGGGYNAEGANGYCGGGGGSQDGSGGTGSASAGGAGGGGLGSYSSGGRAGGGGGYGTFGYGADSGANGGTNTSGNANIGGGGGGTYGDAALSDLMFGSGGGASGKYSTDTRGLGGAGGGIIAISAANITVGGAISSNAANGTAGTGSTAGGGGGAGGSIKLAANTLALGTSVVTASAGTGGGGFVSGGAGGSGRIAAFYGTSVSGTSSPGAAVTQSGYYSYGLYHSGVISTPNAVSLSDLRWDASPSAWGKVEFQTRTGNSTNPTDGTWEAWKPAVASTNYLSLQDANTHTDWTGSSATVADGTVTRNVDQFEDEDEATAGNTTKFVNTAQGGGYAEATIASTDISAYDYVTAWVYATASGSVVKLGFGEAAGTEQEELVTIDTVNTWQKVYWDLSDIVSTSKDGVTKLRVTNLNNPWNTIHFDNIKAEKAMTTSSGTAIASTPNNYLQYRAILTTTNTNFQPKVYNVQFSYNNSYKVTQIDANNVRLYNYTGQNQELRLDAIVYGADLAEYYGVDNQDIVSGDVVSVSGNLDDYGVPILRKSNGTRDPGLIGVISTTAGQALGIEAEDRRLLALAGRVPVKIATDSAAIKVGDPITSSSTPGRAKKAVLGEKVIGTALEPWDPTYQKDNVMILVGNGSTLTPILSDINAYFLNAKVNATGIAYEIKDVTGETINNIGIFSQALIASIKAGVIDTDKLIAQRIQTPLISPLADGTDVTVQIGKRQEVNGETTDGKFSIQNAEEKEVAAIDSQGNATFSGIVRSQNIDEIEALLAQVSADQSLLFAATSSADLTASGSANIAELITNDLFVTGNAAMSSVSIADSLTLGSDLVIGLGGNTINSLSTPLQIQSLAMAPVEIMGGLIAIDTQGNMRMTGNLYVAGRIESSGLTLKDNPEASPSGSLLALQNSEGTQVAGVNASGSASFQDLTVNGLIIAADSVATDSAVIDGVITTNATAGKAVIPANSDQITIRNPKVSDYTLVYVTPTSPTLNNVLYVKSKENGQFVVGFTDPIYIEVKFNWWIVQIQ